MSEDVVADPAPQALPRPVRARVVQLTADVLPDVVRLPPPLRRVAGFAPARRARLGGSAIMDALADEELRGRVGTQVAARVPEARELRPDDEHDPADAAALAWLVRPSDWAETLEAALARVNEAAAVESGVVAEVDRLRARLEQAEQAAREQRERWRAQVEELKAENASLRRKLGETRTAEREARARAEEAEQSAAALRHEAEVGTAAHEKEARQLRAQVAALEATASQERRDARSDRDEASIRARLLLDTVIDAASGLQRELALPPAAGSPGDRLEAELAATGATPGAVAGRGETGAATLEHQLAMPRARLIVDGYNVSKSAFPNATLEAQRNLLLAAIAPLVARTGAQTTVVFDAAETTARPLVGPPRGVKVLFSPPGVIADDVIRDLVAVEPPGRVVVVVSSDRAVAEDVARAGARPAPAQALIAVMGRTG